MSKSLKFDSKGLYKALQEESVKIVNEVSYDIYKQIYMNLYGGARNSLEIEYASSPLYGVIHAQITAFSVAIAQSYGTGKGIDTSSKFFEEYKSSEYWNPLRKGTAVVGRDEGYYKSMFGEAESKGSMAGKEIEFSDIKASKAIQNAEEEYFNNGKAVRIIAEKMNAFLNKNASKYFKYS